MVELSPVIRLDREDSLCLIGAIPLDFVVVRLQDLVSKSTFEFNDIFQNIVTVGGLHPYLKFDGEILLSLIMKDKIISNFNAKRYAKAIKCLKPDSFTTVDGETYEGEFWLSSKELERINCENQELLRLVPNFKAIGLVKGCTKIQIENHIKTMKDLGINDFIFHAGDFLRHGDLAMVKRARFYSTIIRKQVDVLIIYGVGSQKRMIEFAFADRYITFMHFITALNRVRCIGSKKTWNQGPFSSELIINNFIQLRNNAKSLSAQSKLFSGT